METFLIGFLSVAIVSLMYFTLGGRNTLYVFVAISILGVFIGVFEDTDFSSFKEDKQFFACSGTDVNTGTKYTYSLVVDKMNNIMDFEGSNDIHFGDLPDGLRIVSQNETNMIAKKTKDYKQPYLVYKESNYSIDFNRITGKMKYAVEYIFEDDTRIPFTQEFQCVKSEPIM